MRTGSIRLSLRVTVLRLQIGPSPWGTDGKEHPQTFLQKRAEKRLLKAMQQEVSSKFVIEKAERSSSSRVIGIDLGTTNSCVSYIDKVTKRPRIVPSPTGSWVFPTAVTFDRNHTLRSYGEEARATVRTSASATLCSGKRLIGRRYGELGRVQSQLHKTNHIAISESGEVAIEIMGRQYTVVHITAMFLRFLKNEAEKFLKEPVEAAVVSVPAYFTPSQKVATEDAALCAGFDVLEVIDEPSAACLTYTLLNAEHHGDGKKRIHRSLVFDLGGGTLDCAIMEFDSVKNTFTLVATHGDPLLGGNDWDMVLSQHFQDHFEKKWKVPIEDPDGNVAQGIATQRALMVEAEKAKVHFTHSTEPYQGYDRCFHFSEVLRTILPLEVTLTLADYLKLTDPLRDRCVQCLNKLFDGSGFDKRDIDNILLVGAMTRDPPVRKMLEEYFQKPVADDATCPADYAVAIGAAIRGGMLQGEFSALSANTRFVSGTVQSRRSGNFLRRAYHTALSLRSVNPNAIGTRWRGKARGLTDDEITSYAKEIVEFEAASARKKLLDKAEHQANLVMRRVAADSNRRQGMQDRRIKQLSDQLKFWQYMVHNFQEHEERLEQTVAELSKAMDELEGLNVADDDTSVTEEGTIDIGKAFNKLRGYETPKEEQSQEEDPFTRYVTERQKDRKSTAEREAEASYKPAVPSGPKILRRQAPLPKGTTAGQDIVEAGHPAFVGHDDVDIPEHTRSAMLAQHVAEVSWREPPKPPGEEGSWSDVQNALKGAEPPGAPVRTLEIAKPLSMEEQLQLLNDLFPVDEPLSEEHAKAQEQTIALGTMTVVSDA